MQTHSSISPLYVAIDIGKNVHSYAAYSGAQMAVVQPPTEVLSVRSGYAGFCDQLRGWIASGDYAPIVLGMEPTGIYHEAWLDQLLSEFGSAVEIRLLNTLAVRQKREQLHSGRKKKSDALDDQAMAYCLRDNLGYPAHPRQAEALRFALWATAIRQTQRALYRLNVQVLTQVERLWPGMLLNVAAFEAAHPALTPPEPLVRVKPLTRQVLQTLLRCRPNPYDWLPATPDTIQACFHAQHLRCGPSLTHKMLTILDRTLFPAAPIAALLAEQLRTDFGRYQQLAEHWTQLLSQADALVPHSPAAVLTTVPGIAAFLAAQYAAFVGDVTRFQSADQIWSTAGFDPRQDDSGDRRRVGKLSKRGDGAFRQVLFTLGLTTANALPAVDAARQRARKHGKGKIGAILHAAHKVNRLCFRLLRDQVPFDPRLFH